MREIGYGDTTVNQKMKLLVKTFTVFCWVVKITKPKPLKKGACSYPNI